MRYWFSILLLSSLFSLSTAHSETAGQDSELLETEDSISEQSEAVELKRAPINSRSQIAVHEFRIQYPAQLIELPGTTTHHSALYLPANAKTAKGLIVFVPGLFETADSVTNIAQLRRAVTDKGWHSLSLNLPDPEFEPLRIDSAAISLPDTDSSEATADDTLAEESGAAAVSEPFLDNTSAAISAGEVLANEAAEPEIEDYVKTIEQLLDATLAYAANQQTKELIFIAQHEGAYWLLDYLTTHNNQPVNAILLINPRYPEHATQKFASFITELDISTVDFYSTRITAQANEAKERLNASKRKAKSHYQQFKVHAADEQASQKKAQSKVLGWLHRYQSQAKFNPEFDN